VTRALVITGDPTGARMGGNAIRAVELARVLAQHAETTLASPGDPPNGFGADPGSGPCHVEWSLGSPNALRGAIAASGAIVTTPQSPAVTAWLRRSGARLVYDLYDPGPLELLHAQAGAPWRARMAQALALDHLLDALHTGHHFVCAGERQRDLWIGALLGRRLITPAAHARDPDFRQTIDVVPFGVPARAPQRILGAGVRARFPALGTGDQIVLWNGGIWDWLDPVTAVEAMPALLDRRPRARLVFMGRPPEAAAGASAAARTRERAAALGLLDGAVLFNDEWVPYEERESWLLEADCAISTHFETLETRYSFRTRLLDCLWAGLPVVCTGGDELSEQVARQGLGLVVAPGNPGALAEALAGVLEAGRGHFAGPLAAAASQFTWDRVAAPLVRLVTASGPPPPALGNARARRLDRPTQQARAFATRAGRGALRSLGRMR
jgi:glycosyltransferase involved in cell wall biosynthesis